MLLPNKSVLSLFIFVCFTAFCSAQVTIGNKKAPSAGALLDLKEDSQISGGVTSSKGLGLPRVQLISPNELYPMFSDIDESYDTAEKKKNQKLLHAGMIVYVPDVFSNNRCPGTYVWNGEDWLLLGEEKKEEQSTITDGEGNVYHYKKFGRHDWLTDNVRTLTVQGKNETLLENVFPEKRGIGVTLGQKYNPDGMLLVKTQADIDNFGMHAYIINGDKIELSLNDYVNKFGLQYNYEQARKACPDGWRLPNKSEWDELYIVVQNMSGLSAAEAGMAMKNDKSIYGLLQESQLNSWSGPDPCDINAPNVFFNALPSGAGDGKSPESGWTFGDSGYWWVEQGASTSTTGKTLLRYALKYNATKLEDNILASRLNRYSIRCVR